MWILNVDHIGAENAFLGFDSHPAVLVVPDLGNLHVLLVTIEGVLVGLPDHIHALTLSVEVFL